MALISDFLDTLFSKSTSQSVDGETVTIKIPAKMYYKQLAVHTAISLIAAAIGKSEVMTFMNDKPVKEDDYYRLNVSPNPNQTSTQFWHQVIEKMYTSTEGEALAVLVGDNIFCADSYGIIEQQDIKGHKYGNITIGTLMLNRTYRAENVYLFKMDSEPISKLINDVNKDYKDLISGAVNSFKTKNAKRYKLKIDASAAGDSKFQETYTNVIQKQLEAYMKGENAVYPEFKGYDLTPDEGASAGATSSEIIQIRKDMFEMVSGAFKIPLSLMTGDAKDMNNVMDEFLTFAVDPVADMITEALNKRAGYENWKSGNYYKVKTSSIYHYDILKNAANIDKLIACGYSSIDEIRKMTGEEPYGTEWSQANWMTKNYTNVDLAMKGGEQSE